MKATLMALLAMALLSMFGAVAHAAVDPTVTTKITEFGNDGNTYATAIMLACFSIWAVKKLARKMGWF